MSDPLELKMCRACLASDVKLFSLNKTGLLNIFADLTRNAVAFADGLPLYVCYYCRGQLQKITAFRDRCRKAVDYFQQLCVLLEIPGDPINIVKRPQPSIPLSQTKNLILDYLPQETSHFEQIIEPEIYSHIKNVVNIDNFIEDLNNYDDFDENYDDKGLIEQVNENTEDVVENKVTIEIKVENELKDDKVIVEPLTELKTKKRSKTKHKTKPPKNKYKKTDKKPNRDKNLIQNKKSNRFNEKFEEDFEEFSKLHNVKVVCLSKEDQLRKIEERKESKEYKKSRFSCDICYKGFMSLTPHKRHMKAHDPSSGAHVCEICKLRYPSKRRMITHARSHKKIFVCTLCEQVNVNTTRAKLHSRWHKGVKFECNICNKEYNAHTTYLTHVRETHKPVSCTDCGDTFNGTTRLNKHVNSVHTQCECNSCGVVFQNTKSLERHQSDPCDGKTAPCVLCGMNFTHRPELTAHMKQTHGEGEIYTCEQCSAVFPTDRALGMHFANVHYSIRSLKRSSVDKQMRKTQFLCEWCAKSFPTPLRLKLHLHTHTGDTPYECSVCQKRLKTKAGLEFHINSHTGQRPYKCRICSETFKSHAHRYNHHLMKHTQRERRHACQSCEKCFMSAAELRKHVRYVHLKLPRHRKS